MGTCSSKANKQKYNVQSSAEKDRKAEIKIENPITEEHIISKPGNSHKKLSEVSVLLYYFSAHWCPPCKKFTPNLAKLYKLWNQNDPKIEIIFISLDNSSKEFNDYYAEMPWLALKYGDPLIQELAIKYSITGVPKLCLIGENGVLLEGNARNDVENLGFKALSKWQKMYDKK